MLKDTTGFENIFALISLEINRKRIRSSQIKSETSEVKGGMKG